MAAIKLMRAPSRYLFLCVFITLIVGCDQTTQDDLSARLPETVRQSPSIDPVPPVPEPKLLDWQAGEMYMFIHFGMNTFTGDEWGDGTADPDRFNPADLDTDQWARVAKEAGFSGVIFTAKHHDGFALWPTQTTDYSVASSSWQNGQGNVVADLEASLRAKNLDFGIYLSPWDRHEPTWGTSAYNDFYLTQVEELFTGYGEIFEYWYDGARGTNPKPPYDLRRWYETIYSLQPGIVIFGGPDIRWVGNETANSPETQWSVVNDNRWFPAECDVPNRPGWFWRPEEDEHVKPAHELLDIYYSSVGRNCVLLLNVPPDSTGILPAPDVHELQKFTSYRKSIFDANLAADGVAVASSTRMDSTGWAAQNMLDSHSESFWVAKSADSEPAIEISLPETVTFNRILMEEPIKFGQRVEAYTVSVMDPASGRWQTVHEATTIGYRKIDRFSLTSSDRIRITFLASRGPVAISTLSVHLDPYLP